jgi:uncharacterized protein YecE (DUF72 family)
MPDFFVGTGGWDYFKVPNKQSLKTYSEVFNFVEVNYTFYEYPNLRLVEGWSKTVPKDFTFSVLLLPRFNPQNRLETHR